MPHPENTIYAWSQAGGTAYAYAGWKIGYPDGRITKLKSDGGRDTYDFSRVVNATGVQHWIRKGGYWIPDPKGKSTARPCCEKIRSPERYVQYWPCDKTVKEDGLCGTHLRARNERARKHAEFTEERERGDAGKRIAEDAAKALRNRGYQAEVHYHIPIGSNKLGNYDGRVRIHAEDVLALIRRVEHLEGFIGVEPGDEF